MDPSMLIAFLIRDENDWQKWRQDIESHGKGQGQKPIVHVADRELSIISGHGSERESAVDEVEILSDDEFDGDHREGEGEGEGEIGGEADVITISGSEV